MPNAQNIALMEQIKEDVQAASAVWVIDYRGLTAEQSRELRNTIREAGAHMKVYKNTLMHRAVDELGFESIDEILEGPSAFVFAGEDAVAAAKTIKEYAKSNNSVQIKGGLMDGAYLTAEQVQAVADLPSKEQLIGQIAGLISGMARGLAVSISGISRGLAVATAAVAEQKPAA